MTRRPYILGVIFVFLAAYFVWLQVRKPARISPAGYMAAPIPRELAGEPKKVIPAKAEVYKDKHRAMEKLGMDEADSQDDAEDLAAAAEIPATPAGAKVGVFLNTSTGKFRTVVKANPVPFWSFERGTELGVRYGATTRGDQAIELFIRRDLARIGKVYVSAYGEASARLGPDPRPEAKAMIEASGRFHNLPGIE